MPQEGVRHVANVAASQRVVDLHRPILLLDPDAAPLAVISSQYYNGAREVARDPKFTWHNDKLWDRHDAINDATPPNAAATTWTVDNGDLFTVDDLVYVPRTEEVVVVTDVTGDDLTVERAVGASVAADLADNEPLVIFATAAEEYSLPRTARSENPVVETNYTQIFKRTTEASGTWLSSSNESTPHDWPHQVRKDMIEHQVEKEFAFLFGSPGLQNGPDGRERRTTGGLLHYMVANNTAAGGAWTVPEIATFIKDITRHGSKTKTFFHSRLIGTVFDEHSTDKLQTHTGEDTFGVAIREWMTSNGILKLVSHPLLEGSPELDGLGVAVDFKSQAIGYRYLAGDGPGGARDTHYRTNVEEPGRDGRRDQILAECGLRVGLPETGGVVTGVTGAS